MAYQQIYDHLMKLIEKYLEPHAFRQVKDAAGMTSFQEDDKDYLPPCFCPHQCYIDICKEAGWIPKKKCKKKSIFKKRDEWELMPHYYRTIEDFERSNDPEGQVADPIVSWTAFLKYWKDNFPNLVVRAKGEDTCTDCHKLAMELRELYKKQAALMRSMNDVEGGDDTGITPEELLAASAEIEEKIKECKLHVEMHMAQRELFNEFKTMAKADFEAGKPIDQALLMAVIDMAQNCATPFLGDDQMGDFYYMSPLIHYVFGMFVVCCLLVSCIIFCVYLPLNLTLLLLLLLLNYHRRV